jgi:hypothetical protein
VPGKKYPLEIELVPKALWGMSLAQTNRKQWDKLRLECYANAQFKCEICGGTGTNGRIEAHEVWEYVTYTSTMVGIQKLVRLIALCPNCHAFKHFGRSNARLSKQVIMQIVLHAKRVNGWSAEEFRAHQSIKFNEWELRNRYLWTQDLSAFFDDIAS